MIGNAQSVGEVPHVFDGDGVSVLYQRHQILATPHVLAQLPLEQAIMPPYRREPFRHRVVLGGVRVGKRFSEMIRDLRLETCRGRPQNIVRNAEGFTEVPQVIFRNMGLSACFGVAQGVHVPAHKAGQVRLAQSVALSDGFEPAAHRPILGSGRIGNRRTEMVRDPRFETQHRSLENVATDAEGVA